MKRNIILYEKTTVNKRKQNQKLYIRSTCIEYYNSPHFLRLLLSDENTNKRKEKVNNGNTDNNERTIQREKSNTPNKQL